MLKRESLFQNKIMEEVDRYNELAADVETQKIMWTASRPLDGSQHT